MRLEIDQQKVVGEKGETITAAIVGSIIGTGDLTGSPDSMEETYDYVEAIAIEREESPNLSARPNAPKNNSVDVEKDREIEKKANNFMDLLQKEKASKLEVEGIEHESMQVEKKDDETLLAALGLVAAESIVATADDGDAMSSKLPEPLDNKEVNENHEKHKLEIGKKEELLLLAQKILKAVTIRCTDIVNRCRWNGMDARRVVYIATGTEVTTTLIGLNITSGVSDLKQ